MVSAAKIEQEMQLRDLQELVGEEQISLAQVRSLADVESDSFDKLRISVKELHAEEASLLVSIAAARAELGDLQQGNGPAAEMQRLQTQAANDAELISQLQSQILQLQSELQTERAPKRQHRAQIPPPSSQGLALVSGIMEFVHGTEPPPGPYLELPWLRAAYHGRGWYTKQELNSALKVLQRDPKMQDVQRDRLSDILAGFR